MAYGDSGVASAMVNMGPRSAARSARRSWARSPPRWWPRSWPTPGRVVDARVALDIDGAHAQAEDHQAGQDRLEVAGRL